MSDAEELKRIAYRLAAIDAGVRAIDDGVRAIDGGARAIASGLAAMDQFVRMLALIGTNAADLLHHHGTRARYAECPNPLCRFGAKCFSQNDEDGITLEIVRRLGVERGSFAEFGVGDGMENNTIILGALGWRGFWVGGEDLAIAVPEAGRLRFTKDWITLENIGRHARAGLGLIGADSLDVVSLDLDGNDIYLVENLLGSGFRPKLFIVEYNGKFPPPARFQIAYDPAHAWKGDDYFGAALANFADVFERHRFRLVCCNASTGSNAFFVRDDFSHLFEDVPKDIRDIYIEPRSYLYRRINNMLSPKVVETVFM